MGGKESKLRKAAAWLTEKIGEAKLELDDSGKWAASATRGTRDTGIGDSREAGIVAGLRAASNHEPEIGKLDLARLERRARDQFDRVEAQRLLVARAAFGV